MGSKFDFSGYATKNDLLCSDGRTIRKDAFKEQSGSTVPLVWNHDHHSPENVLGHALLENREDGVYAYCTCNDTEKGQIAKSLVKHGDVVALSIFANKLKQQGGNVLHGAIREVSLVLAGANPGATIDSFVLEHGDYSDEEAIISYVPSEDADDSLVVEHTAVDTDNIAQEEKPEAKPAKEPEEEPKEEPKEKEKEEENMGNLQHADEGKTVQDVFDTLTEEQKNVVYAIIGQALEDAKGENSNEGEKEMKHNVFDGEYDPTEYLSHAEMEEIFADASRGTLKDAVLAHGIENLEYLFPDAKNVTQTPGWIEEESGWVTKVMNGVHHTPFSRIKSMFADITADEARARGYLKGNRKEDEVFTLLKRITEPQTIYKKQSFDRDDVIDITDFDVIAWVKTEMRSKLNEELARAVLVGDGRSTASNDKIKEDRIRPIWTDDDLYTVKSTITLSGTMTDSAIAKAFIKAAIKSRKEYKGSGNPVLFTTEDVLTDCLLIEDTTGRVIYDTEEKLRTALRVREIITVPAMELLSRVVGTTTHNLLGIIVNLSDYNVGADKGGAVNMFDDFDIDYNKQKYLIETRCSGALIKPYSAIAIESVVSATLVCDAKTSTATILGKLVSDLQTGITVTGNAITGSLKYVTGYTGFSGDPEEQSGNFLALQFTAPTGSTTKIQLVNGIHTNWVTLDSDMDLVLRITDKHRQKLKVMCTLSDGTVMNQLYDLSLLNCAEA